MSLVLLFIFTCIIGGCGLFEFDPNNDGDNSGNNDNNSDNSGNNTELPKNSQYSFIDNFDGDSVDLIKWSFQNGDGSDFGIPGWGNNEQQYYRAENASVSDGILTITAKREDFGGKNYTSSKLVTQGLFYQKYGRIEANVRLTKALDGLWPAFWMMPQESAYGGWPRSGEIDIMELKGRLPLYASSAIHFGSPHTYIWDEYIFDEGFDITHFHCYAVEWTEDYIEFSVDGEVYQTINKSRWFTSSAAQTDNAPFDKEFYLILNLAVGGNFDGNITPPDNEMPAALEIDFVRAYALEDIQKGGDAQQIE